MSNILAKILSEPGSTLGIRTIDGVPGIESAQVVLALVREDGQEREYLCVNCYPVQPSPEQCRLLTTSLRQVSPLATIAVQLTDDGEGRVTLSVESGQPGTATGCAAAFAVYKVSWGWDESPMMTIQVNADEIKLSVEGFNGEEWSFRNIE
jgi:hypothetical protein